MKTIGKIYISILGLSFILISCIGSLDEIKPQYKLIEETLFTDAYKTEAALNGVYTMWRKASYLPGNIISLSGTYQYKSSSEFNLNQVRYENGKLKDGYIMYYQIIQNANFVIDAMQTNDDIYELTTTRRLEIEGEARLHRALAHLSLLEIFGQFYDLNSDYGIVVRTVPAREVKPTSRNTVQDVYDAILKDLDFSALNAPTSNVHYRVSSTFAKAVKAKVLLYMQNYEAAAEIALEVIGDDNYALEENYSDIFNQGFYSREVLFSPYSVQYTDKTNARFDQYFITKNITQFADAEVGTINDGDPETGAGYDIRYSFAHATGLLPYRVYNGKYPFIIVADQQDNSLFIMRMAEVYLIYAEAKARTGAGVDSDALAKMNMIRTRAGMPVKSPANRAELIEAIRIEKMMELFGEWAQPWFDMIRYHKLGDINISDVNPQIIDDHQLIMPIPRSALQANNLLVQNPGYAGDI